MTDKLPPSILVIDSDEILRKRVSNIIERYYFSVSTAENAETTMRLLDVIQPHVIVISSRMQGTSALEMGVKIRRYKNFNNIPIVMLIDEGENQDNYKSLDNDLIQFVYRPFTPSELMSALKILIRKSKPVFKDKVISYKDLSIDLATYKVIRKNQVIHLGPTEFKILQLMIQSPKSIFSRQQIIDYVWGTNKVIEPRTVDVHVNRLRSLLKLHKDEVHLIKTVRASGYCLSLPGEID